MRLSDSFYQKRKLVDLVENQTSYELENSAMHIFETHQQAEAVALRFDSPVLASMFQGKKVMHLREEPEFAFLPGESLILPANELMTIDFPEARKTNPTRCLAMEIGEERIAEVVQLMNERMSRTDGAVWDLMDYNFHFTNDAGIYQILQRLVYLYTENHPSKDFFVSNMVQELVVRILQTNVRQSYQSETSALSGKHRFAFLTAYIKEHLRDTLTVQDLSEQACMSESNFYRVFKQEMGISPVDYINQLRIEKAKALIRENECDLTEVFLACGYKNRSYFNRVFKKYVGLTPNSFRQMK
ncbi:MAG: AraC family transcriptional regulator [Bacteroidota bacterium]